MSLKKKGKTKQRQKWKIKTNIGHVPQVTSIMKKDTIEAYATKRSYSKSVLFRRRIYDKNSKKLKIPLFKNSRSHTDDSIEQSSQINEDVGICHPPQPPIIIEPPTETDSASPQKPSVNFRENVEHPSGFDPSRRRKSEYRQDELVHTIRKSYLLKNFQEEIYAFKHIKEFLHNAVVVLEGHKHISVDVVIEDCIRKIFPKMDPETVHHIRNEMFTTPAEVLNPVYIDKVRWGNATQM